MRHRPGPRDAGSSIPRVARVHQALRRNHVVTGSKHKRSKAPVPALGRSFRRKNPSTEAAEAAAKKLTAITTPNRTTEQTGGHQVIYKDL